MELKLIVVATGWHRLFRRNVEGGRAAFASLGSTAKARSLLHEAVILTRGTTVLVLRQALGHRVAVPCQ